MSVRPRRGTHSEARWRLVLAVGGCAVLLVIVVLNLAQRDSRIVGTNAIPARQMVANVPPHAKICQRGVTLPGSAHALVLSVSTQGQPGPPLDVSVSAGGRVVATGHAKPGWGDGAIGVTMTSVSGSQTGADVCVVNRGDVPLDFFGVPTSFESRLTVGRDKQPAEIALLWFGKKESWFAALPRIARNTTNAGTRLLGAATFWIAFALVLAAGALAVRTLVREAGA